MRLVMHRFTLAVAGLVAGHELAHALSPAHHHDAAHGYIPALALIATPVAVFSMWRLAQASMMSGRDQIRPLELAATQALLFVSQESLESVAVGVTPSALLTDPTLWAGIGAQLFLCATLAGILGLAGGAWARRFRLPVTGEPAPTRCRRPGGTPDVPTGPPIIHSGLGLRGPPAVAVI